MSRLDELIQQFCPRGVEYKAIEDLGHFYTGLTGKSKEDFKDGNAKFVTYMNVFKNPALSLDIEDMVKVSGKNVKIVSYMGIFCLQALLRLPMNAGCPLLSQNIQRKHCI